MANAIEVMKNVMKYSFETNLVPRAFVILRPRPQVSRYFESASFYPHKNIRLPRPYEERFRKDPCVTCTNRESVSYFFARLDRIFIDRISSVESSQSRPQGLLCYWDGDEKPLDWLVTSPSKHPLSVGVINYRNGNLCSSLRLLGHCCVMFAVEWRKQDASNSSGFSQDFQKFATVCCRVIKFFDKAEEVAML